MSDKTEGIFEPNGPCNEERAQDTSYPEPLLPRPSACEEAIERLQKAHERLKREMPSASGQGTQTRLHLEA